MTHTYGCDAGPSLNAVEMSGKNIREILAGAAPAPTDAFPTTSMDIRVASLGLFQLKGVHGFLRLFTLQPEAVAAATAATAAHVPTGASQGAAKNMCIQPDNSFNHRLTIQILKALPLYEEVQQMQSQLQSADAIIKAAQASTISFTAPQSLTKQAAAAALDAGLPVHAPNGNQN